MSSPTLAPAVEPATPAPPPAVAPHPGNPRFGLLDSMRAIAALSIVLTHASGVSDFNVGNPLGAYTARLNFGVTIFFLLSGFLLYRPFVAARREGRPAIRFGDYARRRVLRIVPAYWVALCLLALWPGLTDFGDSWWKSFTFTQIYFYNSVVDGIGPAWTLCIEASFYVALPFLATAIGRLRPSVGGELAILGALAAGALVTRSALQSAGGSYVLQNTLASYLDWFAYGMVLAVVSVAWRGREESSRALRLIVRRPWVPWAGAAVVFWVMSTQLGLSRTFFIVYTDANYLGEHVLYAACAALLLLPAVFGDGAGGWPRRLLAWGVLKWLGLVSYGIFLYHAPLMLELNDRGAQEWLPGSRYLSLAITVGAAALACATLSYYVFERPALKLKDGRRRALARDSAHAPTAPG